MTVDYGIDLRLPEGRVTYISDEVALTVNIGDPVPPQYVWRQINLSPEDFHRVTIMGGFTTPSASATSAPHRC